MAEPSRPPLRLAVLISGGGRTLENIADAIARGELNAVVSIVISSRPGVYGLERAAKLGVRAETVDYKQYGDDEAFSREVFRLIRDAGADLACLCGFLRRLAIPDDFNNKVINIHPALLPGFGGRGMYGHHVHEAVLAAGCKVSGCSVHFANAEYDKGPILLQRTCPVLADDTPDTLAARVFEQECLAYPEAIKLIADGRVSVEGGRTRIA